jgi:hypothetical protein
LPIIKKLNPDIINLCEIKNYNSIYKILNYINNFYSKPYKGYFVENKKNLESQHVGLISKIDPIYLYRTDFTSKYPIENSNCKFYAFMFETYHNMSYILKNLIKNEFIVHTQDFPTVAQEKKIGLLPGYAMITESGYNFIKKFEDIYEECAFASELEFWGFPPSD